MTKLRILLICEKSAPILTELKNYLKQYDNDVYVSPRAPQSFDAFDLYFSINDTAFIRKLTAEETRKKIICIVQHGMKRAQEIANWVRRNRISSVKIVAAPPDHSLSSSHIEEIVWFGLSKSSEHFLILKSSPSVKKNLIQSPKEKTPFRYRLYLFFEKFFSKKNITVFAFLFVFVYHTSFFLPLTYGGLITYAALRKVQENEIGEALVLIHRSQAPVAVAKRMYMLARPTFLLFSLAQIPDDLFTIHEKTMSIINLAGTLQTDANKSFALILKKDKTEKEVKQLSALLSSLKDQMSGLETSVTFLNQKIPSNPPALKSVKNKLQTLSSMLAKIKRVMPHLPELLAENTEKKYLVLFANNMELRPGGGFIGSYGILTVKNLTFEGIDIYDVYDADGQLEAHVEPPPPIRTYLSQPHWFLRDSAFSPDFYENYFQAKYFLEKEKQPSDFDGGILITTSAIQNILRAFGDMYLPDFGEKVNANNFYLKTQLYAEKEFFPGSTQKKSFLAALMRQLLMNLDSVHPKDFLYNLFTSAEEKQIVIYMETESVQKLMDSFYWSGRIIEPRCPPGIVNCYTDFMFPYDANVGVNKANFFLNRVMDLKVRIDADGIIYTTLEVKFRNESLQNIFPGGVYRNYFQILIPRQSLIQHVLLDDVPLPAYDQEMGQFKKVGFYFEIPIQSTRKVSITYQSLTKLQPGKSVYQLLFQKQIGSINNDLRLQISLPGNIFLVNQNFSPLVNNNQINYNTELSADKIFFVELLKQ